MNGPKLGPGRQVPTLRDAIAIAVEKPMIKDLYGTHRIIAEWKERYRLADKIIEECRSVPPAQDGE